MKAISFTFNDVYEKTQRHVQELICLVQLNQVNLCTVLGSRIQLLVTVSVRQPHNLKERVVKSFLLIQLTFIKAFL